MKDQAIGKRFNESRAAQTDVQAAIQNGMFVKVANLLHVEFTILAAWEEESNFKDDAGNARKQAHIELVLDAPSVGEEDQIFIMTTTERGIMAQVNDMQDDDFPLTECTIIYAGERNSYGKRPFQLAHISDVPEPATPVPTAPVRDMRTDLARQRMTRSKSK